MKRSLSPKSRRQKNNWPAEWEQEADRLAQRFVRILHGIADEEKKEASSERSVDTLTEIRSSIHSATIQLKRLLDEPTQINLVRVALAKQAREMASPKTDEIEVLLGYGDHIEKLTDELFSVVQDIGRAVTDLKRRAQIPLKGRPTKYAVNMTIYAAVPAYHGLFKRLPGKSNSDSGTFGKFVAQIFDRIPKQSRPLAPSPRVLTGMVRKWLERHSVSN